MGECLRQACLRAQASPADHCDEDVPCWGTGLQQVADLVAYAVAGPWGIHFWCANDNSRVSTLVSGSRALFVRGVSGLILRYIAALCIVRRRLVVAVAALRDCALPLRPGHQRQGRAMLSTEDGRQVIRPGVPGAPGVPGVPRPHGAGG